MTQSDSLAERYRLRHDQCPSCGASLEQAERLAYWQRKGEVMKAVLEAIRSSKTFSMLSHHLQDRVHTALDKRG